MQRRKRKFTQRIETANLPPTPSSTAQYDDATPSVVETNVPPNIYKRMRVAECRCTLLDRDNEIERLKLALEASQQESLSKDTTIANRKVSMQKMSKEAQAS